VAVFPLGCNPRRRVPNRMLGPVLTRAATRSVNASTEPNHIAILYRCSVALGAGLGVGLAAVAVRAAPPACRMVILLIFTGSSGRSF
jgi:hypothetical protein